MRKTIRKIHLCLGLLSGIILSIVGITGSLYVFEPEISALLATSAYKLDREQIILSSDTAVAEFIEKATEKTIHSLQWPQRGRETFSFKLFDSDDWYFLDQSSGKITNKNDFPVLSLFDFLLDLHMSLTLGDPGYYITATTSLIFALFILTSGLVLWWPRVKGRRKSSFKIKWKASPKRFNYDIHNVTGFYFFVPLFLLGITGAYFTYGKEIQWVVDKISFSKPSPSIWDKKSNNSLSNKKFLSIKDAMISMDKYYPELFRRNLWMTNDKDGSLSFAYQKYNQIHAGPDTRIFLKINPYTGEILGEENPEKLPRGEALTAKWLLPIHFGEFGGLLTRILWFFAGFIPLLLTYSGAKIWLNRKTKDRVNKIKGKIGDNHSATYSASAKFINHNN